MLYQGSLIESTDYSTLSFYWCQNKTINVQFYLYICEQKYFSCYHNFLGFLAQRTLYVLLFSTGTVYCNESCIVINWIRKSPLNTNCLGCRVIWYIDT